MRAGTLFLAFLLLAPAATAQAMPLPYQPTDVLADPGNQRIDLSWQAPPEDVNQYVVHVFFGGQETENRTVNGTTATFFLTNGRTYTFQVASLKPDGSEGPRSPPVAATPHLENDLAYLAVGLIVVWVGVFAYIGFLARREADIDEKLERILQTKYQGRTP